MKKLLSSIVLASLSLSLFISLPASAAARANVIITTDGPEAQEITVGSNDVALLNLHIDTNARVNFANFPIRVRMPEDPANTAQGLLNGIEPNLTDIKVINSATGEVLMGPIDSTQLRSTIDNPNTTITDRGGDQIAFFLFEDDFIARIYYPLDLTITADIADNANLDGSNVTMTMRNSAAYPEIRKMSNNAWATLNPRGNIDGPQMNITVGNLEATVISDYELITAPAGSQNVNFHSTALECADAYDCEIDQISFEGFIDDNVDHEFNRGADEEGHGIRVNEIISSVWLVNTDGEIIDNGEFIQKNGDIQFINLDYEIPAGETEEIHLMANVSNNAFLDNDGEQIFFRISQDDGIGYRDENNNSFSVENIINENDHPVITTVPNGTLSVQVSPETPNEDIIAAGSENQIISRFLFEATDENFIINKLSVNARQINDAINNQSLGNQDNNVDTITLAYTNRDGEFEENIAVLTNGTAQFEGLNIFVERDEDAEVFIYADVNQIQAGATAGEVIDLSLALNNFEAVGQASGSTLLTDTLDFGDITWENADGGLQIDGDQFNNREIRIDDGNGARPNSLPVGSLICIDNNQDAECENEPQYVVTSWGQSVGIKNINSAPPIFLDNTQIFYALPGANYLTETNPQHLYSSKPSLSLSASSPSGARNVSIIDHLFQFNISAAQNDDILMESININLQGTSLNENPAIPATCSLKDGQQAIAETTADVINNSTTLKFRPENNFEISRGTTKTLTLACNTSSLIASTPDDDLLTPTINFGTANESGDFTWTTRLHPETIVHWIGDQGLRLEGNTLSY